MNECMFVCIAMETFCPRAFFCKFAHDILAHALKLHTNMC